MTDPSAHWAPPGDARPPGRAELAAMLRAVANRGVLTPAMGRPEVLAGIRRKRWATTPTDGTPSTLTEFGHRVTRGANPEAYVAAVPDEQVQAWAGLIAAAERAPESTDPPADHRGGEAP
ncbi:hypothetical protein BDK92_7182 [Micromonospora pisi]|uniref:Uncharacterized protein n=1 Tax=Micromonospora pisi TaxID=589240 RepID=A0A495JWR8_9ACTN|nr:hypothetical protein [Micromonospora pisi]RKR92704.1 hypothetical protein BDK92_7182 [Micromonospora pisi]